MVAAHPLKPAEGGTFHIEGSYSETVVFRCVMEFEEVVDFEYPTDGILSIKFWNFKFHMGSV